MKRFCIATRTASLLLTAALAGCTTVGPDFVPPEAEVADSWIEAHDARIDTSAAAYRDWWSVFNDPVLNALIDKAYSDNPNVEIAGLRILEARARLGIATGLKFPQSQTVGGSVVRAEASENAPPLSNLPPDVLDRVDTGSTTWSASFDIAWEADIWGRFRRGIEAAEANLASNMLNYDAVLVTLTGDVALTYVTLRTLEERLAYLRENVALQEESLELAETRFEFGATSELDVVQSRSLLREAEAAIPLLQMQISMTRNVLSQLLGMPPSTLEDLLGTTSAIPAPPAAAAVGIPADLVRRRPDVRAAEMAAAAQSAAIGVAQADLYPQFVLAGSFGIAGETFSDQFESGSGTGFIAPLVNWNIFNYDRLKNNVRVQDARFQQLVLAYEAVVLNAAREIEDGLVGFLRSQERVAALELAIVDSRRAVEIALDQYDAGLVDYQRVLNSQTSLLAQQDALADSRGQIVTSLVSTYRALGGGWQLREGKPFVDPDILDEMRERTNWGELLDE